MMQQAGDKRCRNKYIGYARRVESLSTTEKVDETNVSWYLMTYTMPMML